MSFLCNALEEFEELTKKPETYLSNENVNDEKISEFLKDAYDFIKNQETDAFTSNALPELITQHFDVEQIWQQIELQNDAFLAHSLGNVSKFMVTGSKLRFNEVEENAEEEDINVESVKRSESDESSSSEEEDDKTPLNLPEDTDEDDENDVETTQPQKKWKSSVVDDDFFKLEEMEAFLESEERRMQNEEPDSGNDTENDDEDEENEEEDEDMCDGNDIENTGTERGGVNNPKYNDFFKKHEINTRNDNLEQEQEGEDEDDEEFAPKSALQEREQRLRQRIEDLEEVAVSEKPWQLKGEITGEGRPQNSLLEEIVDFDMTSRPAPVITEKTSLQLEDIIRQRIKDATFDSVERKEAHVDTAFEYKKKLLLNQEKSKESLAHIYEKEYMKQVAAESQEDAEEEEEPELHGEIKGLMASLFAKLDALSNFHFTPKAPQPEMKVVSNLPAIAMEEVAPVGVSDGALLAPQEVKEKVRGDVIGKSERSETDKKRERRKKKLKQQKHAKNVQKEDKSSKKNAERMLEKVAKDKNVDIINKSSSAKSVKSSTAFFAQLEDEVKAQMARKSAGKQKQVKSNGLNAKKLKL